MTRKPEQKIEASIEIDGVESDYISTEDFKKGWEFGDAERPEKALSFIIGALSSMVMNLKQAYERFGDPDTEKDN